MDRDRKGLQYPAVFQADKADVFVSYCTNAVATAREMKGLTHFRIPEHINVRLSTAWGSPPTREFYELFYHMDLSEDRLDALMQRTRGRSPESGAVDGRD